MPIFCTRILFDCNCVYLKYLSRHAEYAAVCVSAMGLAGGIREVGAIGIFINGTTSTHLLNGVQSNISADEGVLC